MGVTLEKSLQNRQTVINNVYEEIVGPGQIRAHYMKFNPVGSTVFESKEDLFKPYYWEVGGVKEEILQRENPRGRYVSGLLFPLGTNENDEVSMETPIDKQNDDTIENDKLDELFERKEGVETTEDEGEVELFPQRNDFMPSTLGLTFCIGKEVPSISIKIEGGTYTPHNVRVKDESGNYQWWLRESIEGFWDIQVSDLIRESFMKTVVEMKNKAGNKISHYQIQLQAVIRQVKDQYIVTISCSNRSELLNIKREQAILFQSVLRISTPEDYTFSIYPKQYQMKQLLNEQEASTELLYRNEGVYAFGHGCAAHWEQNHSEIREISSTFMPEYETLSMTPNVVVKRGDKVIELEIKMSDLAGLSSSDHPRTFLRPLIEGYRNWIDIKEKEIKKKIPTLLQPAAEMHMKLCRESLDRMEVGLDLLDNDDILEAFRLANLAILLQQENGTEKREGRVDNREIVFSKPFQENLKDEGRLKNAKNSWRAFQIAFILMSIESLINEKSESRDIVDLIWFPTGGGKTEAYLGVAAFQIILRRLRNPLDAGVDVMMRYTLRLLTADQFQRSSRLICALEYLRLKHQKLGDIPFSIGIWVGSQTTPNNNKLARKQLNNLQKKVKNAQQFIVNSCPWCGADLGYYHESDSKAKHYFGYKMANDCLVIHCPDRECHFHKELPIYIVDETIYQKRPTFLIGTVDKFVQLVWQPKARALFGIGNDGTRIVNPPSLIVQDELHLISGPLGTLTGLFETLIEELCLKEVEGNLVKPKIIAATATIQQFQEQALALFGREKARLFPSPGLDSTDSFFATPALDEKTGKPMPGRKYVGVYTQSVRIMMSQVMTYSSILQSTKEIKEDERDPYWTLLTFYNTLRELGGGLTLTQTDIPQYSLAMGMRKGTVKDIRYINQVLELTSRKQSHEISKTIDDLKVSYRQNKDKKRDATIDLCLASNIIEVGVDIDRLSVMAIVGQPKMTAQYIQVSGRVGRRWWERPGLIFTLYANTRSRDKSHFEHFREYHQKLYAQVEPTSVTPFSDSCLERGLHAVIIGFLRQALSDDLGRTPDWKEIQKYRKDRIAPFFRRLIERATLVDPEQVEELKERIVDIMFRLQNGKYTSWVVSEDMEGYMYSAGTTIPKALRNKSQSMINSMRNVDSECRGLIVSIYNEVNENDDGEGSDVEEWF